MEAIAQICEIEEDYSGAIHALKEELNTFKTEWNFTEGETADAIKREIERLERIVQLLPQNNLTEL